MSESVDNRVVEMRFENDQFEKGIDQSSRSLDRFKSKLDFSAASKGMKELEQSSNNVKLAGLTAAAESVHHSFSKMDAFIGGIILNISNDVYSLGKRMVKALSVDSIMGGFNEYELKLKSIQTIWANTSQKGTTLDDVNKSLDRLNTYADETIYNFAQMTENMGKFTAAGLGLQKAEFGIKGMLNLAGLAGTTNESAQRAMYQVSQALSTGVFKLQDWNSITNAGLDVEQFRDAIGETAKRVGVDYDGLIKKYGSFRNSLQTGWLTSEIMMESLLKLTGDYSKEEWIALGYTEEQAQAIIELGEKAVDGTTKVRTFSQLIDTLQEELGSGWTNTWETVVGDFEEATDLFSGWHDRLSQMITDSSNARIALIEVWKNNGGRLALVDTLTQAFETLESVVKPIKEAFDSVFDPISGEQLAAITKKLNEFVKGLKLTDAEAANLKIVFTGLFTVIKSIIDFVIDAFNSIKPMFSTIRPLLSSFVSLLASIVNMFKKTGLSGALQTVLKGISNSIASIMQNLANGINSIPFDQINSGLDNIVTGLGNIVNYLGNIFKMIGEKIGPAIKEFFQPANNGNILNLVGLGELGGIAAMLYRLQNTDKIENIVKPFKDLLSTVKDFKKEGFSGLANKFLTIGTKSDSIVGAIKSSLNSVANAMGEFQKKVRVENLKQLAVAFGIFAASLFVLSKVDTASAVQSIIAVAAAVGIMVAAVQKLQEISVAQSIKKVFGKSASVNKYIPTLLAFGVTMMNFATAVLILSAALKVIISALKGLKDIGSLDEIKGGLIALVVTIGSLTAMMAILANTASGLKGLSSAINVTAMAVGIVAMAGALKVVSLVVQDFAEIDHETLQNGLLQIVETLVALVATLEVMKGSALNVTGFSVALTLLSASLMALIIPLKTFMSFDHDEFLTGLISIVEALVSLVGILEVMKGSALNVTVMSGALTLLSAALVALFIPIKAFSTIGLEEIGKAILGLVVSIGVLVAELDIMSGAAGNVAKMSAAMIVMAVGLTAMYVPLKAYTSMDLKSMAVGLGAIFATMMTIGVTTKLLDMFAPALTKVSLAMLAFGAATLMIGAGVALITTAFGSLGTVAGIAATAIIGAIPMITLAAQTLIIAITNVIIACAPNIANAIATVITTVLETINDYLPQIAEAIVGIINGLAKYTPEILDAVKNLLASIWDWIKEDIATNGTMAAVGVLLVGNVTGVLGKILTLVTTKVPAIIAVIKAAVTAFTTFMSATAIPGLIAVLSNPLTWVLAAAAAIGVVLVKLYQKNETFRTAVNNMALQFGEAFNNIKQAFSDFGDFVGGIFSTIFGWFDKLHNNVSDTDFSNAYNNAFGSSSSKYNLGNLSKNDSTTSASKSAGENDGKNYTAGYANGVDSLRSEVAKSGRGLVTTATTSVAEAQDSHSPAKVSEELGLYFGEGYANGLDDTLTSIKNNAVNLVQAAEDGVTDGMEAKQDSMNEQAYLAAKEVMTQYGNGMIKAVRAKEILEGLAYAAEQTGTEYDDQTAQAIYDAGQLITEKTGMVMDDVILAMDRTEQAYNMGSSIAKAFNNGLSESLNTVLLNYLTGQKSLSEMKTSMDETKADGEKVSVAEHAAYRDAIAQNRENTDVLLEQLKTESDKGTLDYDTFTNIASGMREKGYLTTQQEFELKTLEAAYEKGEADQQTLTEFISNMKENLGGSGGTGTSSSSSSSSKSAETIRKENYDALVKEFEEALEIVEQDISNENLEYQLLQAAQQAGLTKERDQYKADYVNLQYLNQSEHLQKQLTKQQEKMNKAKEEYDAVVADSRFGESSEEAKKLYAEWLQAQIDVNETQAEINLLTEKQTEALKQAAESYVNDLQEAYNEVLEGIQRVQTTKSDILSLSSNLLGNPSSDAEDTAKSNLSSAVSNAQSVYSNLQSEIDLQKRYNEMVAEYGANSDEAKAYRKDLILQQLQNGEGDAKALVAEYKSLLDTSAFSADQLKELDEALDEIVKANYELKASKFDEFLGNVLDYSSLAVSGRSGLDQLEAAQDYYNEIQQAYKEGNATAAQLQEAYNTLLEAQNSVATWSNSVAEKLGLGSTGTKILNMLTAGFSKAWPTFKEQLGAQLESLTPYIKALDVPDDIKEALISGFKNLDFTDLVTLIINKIIKKVMNSEVVTTGITKICNWIGKLLQNALGGSDGSGGILSNIINSIGNALTGGSSSGSDDLISTIGNGIKSLFSKGSSVLKTIGSAITSLFKSGSGGSILTTIGTGLSGIIGKIGSALGIGGSTAAVAGTAGGTTILSTLGTAATTVAGALTGPVGLVAAIAAATIGLRYAAAEGESFGEKLLNTFTGFDLIKDTWSSLTNVFTNKSGESLGTRLWNAAKTTFLNFTPVGWVLKAFGVGKSSSSKSTATTVDSSANYEAVASTVNSSSDTLKSLLQNIADATDGASTGTDLVSKLLAALNQTADDMLESLDAGTSAVMSSGQASLADLISSAQPFNPTSSYYGAASSAGQLTSLSQQSAGESTVSSSTSYNFTQNNYSPKSLSRQDIYRQTRNQFAQFKERTV